MPVCLQPVVYVPQLAEALGCRPRWIEDRVRSGEFPARRISRKWAFTEDDIQEILRRLAVPSISEPLADAGPPVVPQASSMTRTTAKRLGHSGPAP